MPTVRRFHAHEWRAYRDLRLRALADSPDAFGSTVESERQRPDAHWAERLATGAASEWNVPLVAEQGGEFAGLVWGTIDPAAPETAHVIQMWTAPEARGLGCGAMLLDAVVRWARGANARHVLLNVTCGDTPALRLYTRAGFIPAGDPVPLRRGSAILAQPMRLDL
jgi:ribosomal protein S18 acetylase RimI-like enzyme